MAQVNPDPQAYGYAFIPINRITAMFSSHDDIRAALRELHDLRFAGQNIDVFVGEEGADTLDLKGERHGAMTRKLRNVEALLILLADDSYRQADAALRAGGAAVAVLLDGKESLKEKVASVLKSAPRDTDSRLESLDNRGILMLAKGSEMFASAATAEQV